MSARQVSRRRLLRSAAAAAAGVGLSSFGPKGEAAAGTGQAPTEPSLTTERMRGVPFEARDVVRVGLVGCGRRGLSLLNDLLGIEKVDVRAVCDLIPAHAAKAQALCAERKAATPTASSSPSITP